MCLPADTLPDPGHPVGGLSTGGAALGPRRRSAVCRRRTVQGYGTGARHTESLAASCATGCDYLLSHRQVRCADHGWATPTGVTRTVGSWPVAEHIARASDTVAGQDGPSVFQVSPRKSATTPRKTDPASRTAAAPIQRIVLRLSQQRAATMTTTGNHRNPETVEYRAESATVHQLPSDSSERSANASAAMRKATDAAPQHHDEVAFVPCQADPWSALRSARERLSPRGRVLASIPNMRFAPVLWGLLRGRWDYADDGVLDRTHLRFFTRSSIESLFIDTGYVVERCEGINNVVRVYPDRFSGHLRKLRHLLGDTQWTQYAVVARSG